MCFVAHVCFLRLISWTEAALAGTLSDDWQAKHSICLRQVCDSHATLGLVTKYRLKSLGLTTSPCGHTRIISSIESKPNDTSPQPTSWSGCYLHLGERLNSPSHTRYPDLYLIFWPFWIMTSFMTYLPVVSSCLLNISKIVRLTIVNTWRFISLLTKLQFATLWNILEGMREESWIFDTICVEFWCIPSQSVSCSGKGV